MLLVTRSGVSTSLSWWTRASVVGKTVVLLDGGVASDAMLVVAEEASVEEAMRLLVVIEDRIRHRARRFDCRSWKGHANCPSSPVARRAEARDEA